MLLSLFEALVEKVNHVMPVSSEPPSHKAFVLFEFMSDLNMCQEKQALLIQQSH